MMRMVRHIIEEKISNGINNREGVFRESVRYSEAPIGKIVRKNIRIVDMARCVRSDIQKQIEQ